MNSLAVRFVPASPPRADDPSTLASDSRYIVRMAGSAAEVAAALRLRHEVFNRELGVPSSSEDAMEFDQFDLRCKHLVAIDRGSGKIIGTYRINAISANESIDKFYSFDEFTLETLPESMLRSGIEIGRACVAAEHRNSKALFLLWKALAQYLVAEGKQYIFGCCSIFTRDAVDGHRAYRQLIEAGHVSPDLHVTPRQPIDTDASERTVALPPLFEMYLRLGAKVCGPPTYDEAFGSVDFLVVLDLTAMDERYRRMFFGRP